MTFVTREIELSLRLAKGSLDDDGNNVVNLAGHKCDLIIENAGGGLAKSNAQLRVYGMAFSDMNKFATRGMNPMQVRNDELAIKAGDALSGMREVFSGTMNYAIPNLAAAPDVSMEINAVPGLFFQMQPAAANTYPGTADVASIIQGLATQMGFGFENHGVTTKISNHYLHGTLMYQLEDVLDSAGIICCIERGTIKIWPNSGGQNAPVIGLSAQTGLIGYPTFTRTGIQVEMEFRNDLALGRQIALTTSVPKASGTWYIQYMRHELSTQTHQGAWKTVASLAGEGLYIGR